MRKLKEDFQNGVLRTFWNYDDSIMPERKVCNLNLMNYTILNLMFSCTAVRLG